MNPSTGPRRVPRTRVLVAVLTLLPACCVSAAGAIPPTGAAGEPAVSLDRAETLIREARYAEAELALRRLLEATEARHGASSLETARVLDRFVAARLASGLGGHSETEDAARRALDIKEHLQDCPPGERAESLTQLARVLEARGHKSAAEHHYRFLVESRERRLGSRSPDFAASLHILGVSILEEGDPEGARPILERALALEESTLAPASPALAHTLVALALVERAGGRDASASPLVERAAAILNAAYADDPPRLAVATADLGMRLAESGADTEAAPLLERARDLWESAAGSEDRFAGRCDAALARIEERGGHPDRARALYENALRLLEPDPDTDSQELASLLADLGGLLDTMGDLAASRRALERSGNLFAAASGPGSPETVRALVALSRTQARSGRIEEALESALRAESMSRESLRLTAHTLSEREALQAAAGMGDGLGVALSLAARGLSPEDNRRVLDAVIRSRAVLLDETAMRYRTASEVTSRKLARLYDDFLRATNRHANLLVRGSGSAGTAATAEEIERSAAEREAAESRLAAYSVVFRTEVARNRAGIDEVAAALPKHAALLAYARLRADGHAAYLAFVLQAGARTPVVADLGDADAIDAAVAAWGREIDLGRTESEPSEAAYRIAGEALRRRIWDPVAPALSGADRVFIVPDGALHEISFVSLPAGSSYLVERGPVIHYLSAERDLVTTGRNPPGSGLLALGDPAFDAEPGAAGSPAARDVGGPEAHPFRGDRPGCDGFASVRFEPLPASRAEIQDVASLWERHPDDARENEAASVLRLTGSAASERAFKLDASGKRIVHLATHGFFLDGSCTAPVPGTRGIGRMAPEGSSPETAESAFGLSGLALAGANRRSEAGPESEDGILTAEEIAALDLSGVEWAVLSGCDTGIGAIRDGEGVFGLRRAFEVAGCRTLILSLWPIEDAPAREWMRDLYTARFRDRRDTAEAVREADLALLRGRRDQGLSTHPFFWAGFVGTGDWR